MESDARALVGTWRFERTIDDRQGGRAMHASGTATFAAGAAGAIEWHESGSLDTGDAEVEIAAHRVLRRDPVGSWAVEFADGRPFHPWRVGGEVVHDCAPDDYRGRVDLDPAGGDWTQTWVVSGPAKSYTMVTRYSR